MTPNAQNQPAHEILTIACLSDNYAFLIHNAETGGTALIDAPEAPPIDAALAKRGWQLSEIVLTHHDWDHIDGVPALRRGTRVIGAKADAHRLPPLDHAVTPGEPLKICSFEAQVIDVPGHTIGHVAYYIPNLKAAFTADSLMAMGCGRLFEGTPAQMWDSLQRLRILPENTLIYSGHEYATTNARFALSIEPDNRDVQDRADQTKAARAKGRFTVPSSLALEKRTNPFLRADDPALAAALGMQGADALDVFTETRARRDRF